MLGRAPLRVGPGPPGEVISLVDGLTLEEGEKKLLEPHRVLSSTETRRFSNILEGMRLSFRSHVAQLLQSGVLEDFDGTIRIRDESLEDFEKNRICARFESIRFSLAADEIRDAVKRAIMLLGRIRVLESGGGTISTLTLRNYWSGGERVDFEFEAINKHTILTISSYPRWMSAGDCSWKLCSSNVNHFVSLIREILNDSGDLIEENWKVTIIYVGITPGDVPDRTFGTILHERQIELNHAFLALRPELSKHINPDGTLI